MRKQLSALILLFTASASIAADQPPRIIHEPVKAGVTGQPVYIRATVRDDKGAAKAVNLYCSVSSDSAPFKVPMRASGAGAFIGSIPKTLIQNAGKVSYYIEAIDSLEQATETPWYTIKFRTSPGRPGDGASGGKKSSWKKPVLITAGTVAAVGIGVAVAGGGSDDSSDGNGGTTPPDDNSGSFRGNATRVFTLSGQDPIQETYAVELNLISGTTISSPDLHPEGPLSALVTDNSFTMVGSVSTNGLTASVNYIGTISGNVVSGQIDGDGVSASGTNGTYSGFFSATKQ